ncbi:molybdopterin-synthase adenylyltransferase MoeB [Xanthomonas citri pv. anacardii]|uniref:molybdopterin-synthase adenylyltransferase MoeB n=1 Tax=Xanthomonas citri TaxID=346 RepID=UPI0015E16257|nr:molybdopterin-synthase adenylyltransferase MoeB [Xanthomonas citri]MCT8356272.1 molybdopterin-synthase adenylyltransferase MoeB [Xanthomonas citri pv. anacardii]MCT8360281.1 molybdopterin-synthase adenylyltransferase MoeB [Xanthomonas citri pv. anacardii]MCT8363977.1 molybdopterin-synthase adenylyltransferase MoeB [Xanthomonas citri pv. anacardii]MCT8368339.1 molybdopterin-synthase adenylyltransferase MoeB [Xanthomonas citri pv. anacardii]MCT8373784.1 molybdopterin-synthase adenylyltransfer
MRAYRGQDCTSQLLRLRDNGRMSNHDISPADARARALQGALLVDIRQLHERASGQAEGAIAIAQHSLEMEPAVHLPEQTRAIVLICQSGKRSAHTAAILRTHGYAHVASVAGGTSAWASAGLPLVRPTLPADEQDFLERYSRHLRLSQVGLEGQRRLARARVLLIGAGGLGSPAAFYLAAAGVGHLRIADDDVVDRSNLQRQILHTEDSVGTAKVDSAARRIAALNPRVDIEAVQTRVTADNVEALLQDVDVVVDGADNFPARYLLNDACVKLAKPLVYGAVQQFEGQVSVFDAGRHRGHAPCYRCLFPEPPPPEFAPSCAEAGVLGVLPGVIGLLQATEAIKLLLGIGAGLTGRLLSFDALAMRFRDIRLPPDPHCPVCAPGAVFRGYADYAVFCGSAVG